MLDFIIKYWIQILFGLIISLFSYFVKLVSNYKKTLDTTNKGVIVILKTKIIENYNSLIGKDTITIYEKQSISELYDVYEKLECCDVIKDLMEKINSIPIK